MHFRLRREKVGVSREPAKVGDSQLMLTSVAVGRLVINSVNEKLKFARVGSIFERTISLLPLAQGCMCRGRERELMEVRSCA